MSHSIRAEHKVLIQFLYSAYDSDFDLIMLKNKKKPLSSIHKWSVQSSHSVFFFYLPLEDIKKREVGKHVSHSTSKNSRNGPYVDSSLSTSAVLEHFNTRTIIRAKLPQTPWHQLGLRKKKNSSLPQWPHWHTFLPAERSLTSKKVNPYQRHEHKFNLFISSAVFI